MSGHCEETRSRLDDFVDGALDDGARAEAAAHLASCAECRQQERRLRELLAEAAALAAGIEPPSDLWPGIERRIRAASGGAAWPRYLAAAACLALALAGALTLRAPGSGGVALAPRPTVLPAALEAADVEQVERDYEQAAAALLARLRERRGELPPDTVAQVEESLRTIDAALAQIRAALHEQPAEPALHLMLAATHRRKVEVLRRVVEVGA